MTHQELEQLEADLIAYKRVRDLARQDFDLIEREVRSGQRPPWDLDLAAADIYGEVDRSPEREKVSEHRKRLRIDPEFERHFTKAHAKVFLGRA